LGILDRVETTLATGTSPASAQGLEVLRKADEELGHQIFRLSVVRLVFLIVVTLWLAGVAQRPGSERATDTINQIRRIEVQQRLESQALDPVTLFLTSPTWPGARDSEELERLAGQLKQQYGEIFKVRFSLLGTDIEFDLRIAILSCPFWLPIAHIYIQLVRQKRRVIQAIGLAYLQRVRDEQITPLDRLMFSAERGRTQAYRSYPGILVDSLFWLTLLALAGILVQMAGGSELWRDSFVILALAQLVAASAFYSRAYSNHAAGRLRVEAETLFQCRVPEDWFGRIWRRAGELARSLPERVRPRIPLLIGSGLALLTLALNTAELGCGRVMDVPFLEAVPPPSAPERPGGSVAAQQPQPAPVHRAAGKYRPGYELLTGSADWPLSLEPFFRDRNYPEDQFGKLIYLLLLLLGVFSLVTAVLPWHGGRLARATRRVAGRLSAAISICLVGEFANQYFLLTPLWVAPVAAAWLAWLVLGRSASRAAWWARVRNFLVVVFVPIVLANVVYLGSVVRVLPGLVALYCGVHALTLGYAAERRGW